MEENTQKKTENYLLFVPSLGRPIKPVHYTVKTEGDSSKGYEGVQTNEAVTQYLLDELKKKGETLDKIIMLCSKEVMENEINFAQENQPANIQTTYDYYCDKIKQYINTEMGATYEIPEFIQIPYNIDGNNDSNEILKPLQDIVRTTTDGQAESTKRVYVDFSGGLRTSALTLVFACRILESEGLQVEQILYSNLKSTNPPLGLIEDCTNTYYLFDHLAARTQRASNVIADMKAVINKNFKGSKKMLEITDWYHAVLRAINTNQYEQIAQKGGQLKKKIDDLGDEASSLTNDLFKDVIKEAKEIVKNEHRIRLYTLEKELRDSDRNETSKREVVTTFRETSVLILAENGIIDFRNNFFNVQQNKPTIRRQEDIDKESRLKDNLADEFLGAYQYYEKFVKSIVGYAKELMHHLDKSPQRCMEEKYGSDFRNPYTYLKDKEIEKKKPFIHNDNSRAACKTYLTQYIRAHSPSISDVTKDKDYAKLDKIYMRYGYPFACVYSKKFYPGYDLIYKNVFEQGVQKLEAFYQGENPEGLEQLGVDSYQKLVQKIAGGSQADMIAKIFPFKVNTKIIWANKSNSEAIKEDAWNDFIYEYGKALYAVRDVRNKVNHRNQLSDRKLDESVDVVRGIIEKIKVISAQQAPST